MPVTKIEKINSNSFWCLWEITESFEQLREKVVLSEDGVKELEDISHPIKQRERMASRCCVQALMQHVGKPYLGLIRDEHAKPHLIGSDYYISVSHSFPYAAAILHKKLKVGIDIEKPTKKLGKIAHRYLNDQEFADCQGDIKKLCIYWSGKEAIFKLNGKMGLNFKRDIRIAPFTLHKQDVVRSEFSVGQSTARIALNYKEIHSHIVCYCF